MINEKTAKVINIIWFFFEGKGRIEIKGINQMGKGWEYILLNR